VRRRSPCCLRPIPRARSAASQEVSPLRVPRPIHALPPDRTTIVPILYDPEEFAALYHADKDRALALIATMTEPQRVRQALAYAAWLGHHGLEIDLETVLAAWERG
jgi:hypothetical protein